MKTLDWKKYPELDSRRAKTEYGRYMLVRDIYDNSILYFGAEVLCIVNGSHSENYTVAQKHYEGLQNGVSKD